MSFSPRQLDIILSESAPGQKFAIAYSGGLDSHVLLHALSQLAVTRPYELLAVHVNHGLQAAASGWAQHCRDVCRDLKVPCDVTEVNAHAGPGESPEARARAVRYTVLSDYARTGWIVLTAHHRDDQAETFMLQLLRGSGLRGLAAMPRLQSFADGWLMRPLLDFNRSDLQQYAHENQLNWIEDSSNSDASFDRNFLRHALWPRLQARWPAASRTIARAAEHAAETAALAEELARQDRIAATRAGETALQLEVLQNLSMPRRRNLLRVWIRDLGLSVPSTQLLEQIAFGLIEAESDRIPVVCWNDNEIRRYRQRLYLLPRLPLVKPGTCLVWDAQSVLSLPLGELHAYHRQGHGLRKDVCEGGHIQIRFRQGGETIRLPGRRHRHSLKNLLQAAGLPPWLRDLLPLVYINDNLALVPGICSGTQWTADPAEASIEVIWQVPDALKEILASTRPVD